MPEPGENEVLIRTRAIGLNPVDVAGRSNPFSRTLTISPRIPSHFAWYPVYRFFPSDGAYIGCDLAGEIVKLGPNLQIDLKVGDRVSGSVAGGEYSNYPVCPKGKFAESQNPCF